MNSMFLIHQVYLLSRCRTTFFKKRHETLYQNMYIFNKNKNIILLPFKAVSVYTKRFISCNQNQSATYDESKYCIHG